MLVITIAPMIIEALNYLFVCTVIGAELNLSRPSMRPKVGEKIAVLCTVSGGETFSGWYKPGGSRVTDTPTATIRVEASGNTYKLTFADVKVSQGGKYQCRGSKNSKDFLLQVACKSTDVFACAQCSGIPIS